MAQRTCSYRNGLDRMVIMRCFGSEQFETSMGNRHR